jgi:hypothetical protein
MRYTDLMITVDTHCQPKDDEDRVRLTALLKRVLKEYNTAPSLKATILCEDPAKLRRIVMTSASIEEGDKYGRVHAHFNLSIEHETNVYLKHPDGRTLNRVLIDWFNAHLEPETGKDCYVRASLAESSRAKNYATKASNASASGSAASTPSVASFGVRPGK